MKGKRELLGEMLVGLRNETNGPGKPKDRFPQHWTLLPHALNSQGSGLHCLIKIKQPSQDGDGLLAEGISLNTHGQTQTLLKTMTQTFYFSSERLKVSIQKLISGMKWTPAASHVWFVSFYTSSYQGTASNCISPESILRKITHLWEAGRQTP